MSNLKSWYILVHVLTGQKYIEGVLWMCKDARELIKDEWVRGVDEWREGKIGEKLSSKLLRQLQRDPVPALCEYLRAFEKSAKKIRDSKEKQ